ncbi:MAG TPA: Re/Si-specific NAD(P)(+) transhydrogenase subunit alpha [Alphaproteobacteria bacterium]|nr:Re/Si-specific NAD(P)(+) transhydrogenase subunit alpha [Alphaproteobacteria bacterium]
MKIAIPKERRTYEKRVAATPDMVKKYRALGYEVVVEAGAGAEASYPDDQYIAAGAQIIPDAAVTLRDADIVLKVQRPMNEGEGRNEMGLLKSGAVLVAMLNPYSARGDLETYARANITAMSMELMPRITRAQSMDVLSSQSNLAGYKAVLDAAEHFGRAFPMMMTAAGTVPPAKVLVMGAGVAGLQSIATARRLGAVVSATDVRPVAKEQVESLGATFVMVETEETKQAQTAGGYAKEMSDDYKQKQAALIAETIKKQDVVICTALIPGRAAPRLISEEMLRTMKPGSVVVDLAVEQGGNCALSEAGKVVEAFGVKIVGHRNMASRIAVDASALYARNLYNFVALLSAKEGGQLAVNWDDEIVRGVMLTRNGAIVHPQFQQSNAA